MDMNSRLDDLWRRLELQLAKHAPSVLQALRPPATECYLAECESKMSLRLPGDVRHAYLRHDGSAYPEGPRWHIEPLGLFGRFRWLPLKDMLQWHDFDEVFDPESPYSKPETEWGATSVRPWLGTPPQWAPLAKTLSGAVFLFSDMLPGPSGQFGQVVGYTAQNGDLSCWLEARSLSGYLEQLTSALEADLVRPGVVDDGCSMTWWDVVNNDCFFTSERENAFGSK